eukprot:m.199574 g.199574  ORF g.199574 m.199574 type:complete len:70 (+) comp17043_c0_seq68:3223-3432(+)
MAHKEILKLFVVNLKKGTLDSNVSVVVLGQAAEQVHHRTLNDAMLAHICAQVTTHLAAQHCERNSVKEL